MMLDPALQALAEGRHGDPFALLGPHGTIVRLLLPYASRVELISPTGAPFAEAQYLENGVWEARLDAPAAYRLRVDWGGVREEFEDPYSFGTLLSDFDLFLLGQGKQHLLADCLGARMLEIDGVPGIRFAVWAPNARRVSVVGGFNGWDGRRHAMRRRDGGVWEIFIPRVPAGSLYKYEILGSDGLLPLKADPVARQAELPPATASVVAAPLPAVPRRSPVPDNAPLSIYEEVGS